MSNCIKILSVPVFFAVLTMGCRDAERNTGFPVPASGSQIAVVEDSVLPREIFADRIRGMVIGSAIGDAMGAPVEMWHRDQIRTQWGYIQRPEPVIREGSPEGPWDYNLPAGGTTDDTRWKYLMTRFLLNQSLSDLKAEDFARYIVDLYLEEKEEVGKDRDFAPEATETEIRHMTWLQEWAMVAQTLLDNDLRGFHDAQSRFYGGEMACAGLLYAPFVGACYPGDFEKAYQQAYQLSLFDLGYARDITALSAAYVSTALKPGIPFTAIGETTRLVDPRGYFKSRLVGRIAYRFYQDAKEITHAAKGITSIDRSLRLPANYPYDSLYFTQVEKAYRLLDEKLQDIPFHAGEIHLINLTALEFGAGDFKKTIEFVVNYGRDNDTVAAVTGAILGAYLGAEKLPRTWVEQVLETNKNRVKIDLEQMAEDLINKIYGN